MPQGMTLEQMLKVMGQGQPAEAEPAAEPAPEPVKPARKRPAAPEAES